jgi:hypothetical protein
VRLRHVCQLGSTSSSSAVLRHRALCTEAAYRLLCARGSIVEVEVVVAPGLEPGMRLHLTAAAVAGMRSVTADSVDRQHLQHSSATRDVHLAV